MLRGGSKTPLTPSCGAPVPARPREAVAVRAAPRSAGRRRPGPWAAAWIRAPLTKSYVSIVILHARYTKRRVNDPTAHGYTDHAGSTRCVDLGLYPTVAPQYSLTTLYQVHYHAQ